MGSLRRNLESLMSLWLMRGSCAWREGKRIGLRKEEGNGCRRRGKKNRDAETRLPRGRGKKERREKLLRGRRRLRRMPRGKPSWRSLRGRRGRRRKNIFEKKLGEF